MCKFFLFIDARGDFMFINIDDIMSEAMSDAIFENFQRRFPFLSKDVCKWSSTDDYEILVELRDGSYLLYDDIDGTIRKLPNDCNSMSESECKKEFGMRLRRLMMLKNITQEELSGVTGIQQSAISNYMTGRTSPSFYNADKIAKALGCSMDELRYFV